MANEIYDNSWFGNTIDTASSIGTSTEMIQGQFNLTKIGDELVTNGDFATDSDWNKETGWSISGGKANKVGAIASNFYQNVFTSGKKYRLTFEISNSNNGRLLIYFGGSVSEDILSASDGVYTFDNVANQGTLIFRNVNWTGSIDNVSVKEVRATEVEAVKCLADAIHKIGIQNIQN